jgi:hypothetical protein
MNMAKAKWREKSGKATKDADQGSGGDKTPDEETSPTSSSASGTATRAVGRRRNGGGVRGSVKRATDAVATFVRIAAMIICILLALHIAFVVFSANGDNAIVRTVNDWADWFAWRFRDMFVPKDHRVEVLVNYGIAAVVYLIVGRVIAGLIARIRV